MQGFTDIVSAIANVVTGQPLINKVRALTRERPWRIMIVMYIVAIVLILRFICNIVESTDTVEWIRFYLYHPVLFCVFLTCFAFFLEIGPVLLVLLRITSTKDISRKESSSYTAMGYTNSSNPTNRNTSDFSSERLLSSLSATSLNKKPSEETV